MVYVILNSAVFILLYKISLNINSRALLEIGDHSFGIYLVHVFFLTEIINLLTIFSITYINPMFYLLTFLLSIMSSYIAVWLWSHLYRKGMLLFRVL
jgi:peptidoglycan/LPS O-acetylase OafA/YrhL